MFENNTEDIKLAKTGDKEALERLVSNNTGLVWNIVKRFNGRGYELEDLYQIGCVGLLKSIKRFNTDFEVQLSTYAVPYILGEIKRFVRDDGPVKVSRSIKELSYRIKLVQKEYLDKKGRELEVTELSKILKTSKEDILIAIDSANRPESIDKNIGDSDDMTLMDKLKSNIDLEKEIINRITVKDLLDRLDEKSKKIIMLRYFRGKTQCQVANLMGISQVQVSRMEKKILNNMKLKLTQAI